ncbi:MAG: hypothetical protein AVO38_11960 [delta proteobacterium ML8_D]|nr:MAG: hypothetical protein AVO38_11960 [delta proteobacterium ML8_D]
MSNKNVFVIMPFSSTTSCTENEWLEVYENVFKPAIEECNYSCDRAAPQTGALIKSIIKELRSSRIVLADLTDQNPNVFYELGVRHALSNRTILVSQDAVHIPSDLRGYWSILYGLTPGKVSQFKKDIKRVVERIENTPDENDNPVSDFLDQEYVGVSNFLLKQNVKQLSALITEITANINTLNKTINNPAYKNYISYDCVNILLNTLYINIRHETLCECYEIRHNLLSIKNGYNLDNIYIKSCIEKLKTLLSTVFEIRNKISVGQYNEPDRVSTLIWEPVPAHNEEDISAYSEIVNHPDIDFEELKKHLDKI